MFLSDPITTIPGVGPSYAQRLKKLNISTIKDLLYHIPSRYLDFTRQELIGRVQVDQTYSVQGEVERIETVYTKRGKKFTRAVLVDTSGSLQLIWFNQTYITRIVRSGDVLTAAGKVSWWDRQKAIITPMWQKAEDTTDPSGQIVPVYPETEGVKSPWLHKTIKAVWPDLIPQLTDQLPESIRNRYALPSLADTFQTLHFPEDLISIEKTRERLAFDEMFALQQRALERRKVWETQQPVFSIVPPNLSIKTATWIENLPFALTHAQQRAIEEITHDLSRAFPMNRLVQGDVGAGKTVVAAFAAYVAFVSKQKTLFMAPTEVLADQHIKTMSQLLEPYNLTVGVLTGTTKTDNIAEADLLIGTHALFHHDTLPQAGLVIIDEQHKFGVDQRRRLVYSGEKTPHILTMTATPIPRSIALTIYGEQDLSLIDELPPGRKPVKTWVVPELKRHNSYRWIKEQIQNHQGFKPQVLIIYPLIEDSEHETMQDVKAATSEFEKLRNEFKGLSVELIHGRLSGKEKNNLVERFREGSIDVLVSTSVVEVGIDAPNASIIIIENAERFGLATLHQLRGRVGRRGQQGYCFLFTPTDDDLTIQRLKALEQHSNGLQLAEIDLTLRGPGELFGTRQHGVGELRFAKITDLKLIQKTRDAVKMWNEQEQSRNSNIEIPACAGRLNKS